MLPSSTVENYLKAIYQGASTLTPPQRLLPMGQLAAALGVVPGTATTMVKALAESGLVEYEPYSGVALTRSGHKLAALVLRRHRLVELFLVRFMGYAWDEVHDEAEQLEHVVSERLIDRMDEMLGRPEVDPHGDPIPNADGQVKAQEAQSLMTCPIGTPVTLTRVVDQDGTFLRFLERHHLKPGAEIQVEERDASADSVRVRGKGDRLITIGTRAASKLLVQVARAALLLLIAVAPALAQDAAAAARTPRTNLSGYMDFLLHRGFNVRAARVRAAVRGRPRGDAGVPAIAPGRSEDRPLHLHMWPRVFRPARSDQRSMNRSISATSVATSVTIVSPSIGALSTLSKP